MNKAYPHLYELLERVNHSMIQIVTFLDHYNIRSFLISISIKGAEFNMIYTVH